MARQTLNTGVTPNDGLGDTLRNGAQKINENFVEVYTNVTNLRSDLTVAQVEIFDIANTITTLATTSYVDSQIAEVSNTIINLIDSDNQTLTFIDGDLSISGGNTVDLSVLIPNLTGYATLDNLSDGLALTANTILTTIEPNLQPQLLQFNSNTSILTISGATGNGSFVDLSGLGGGGSSNNVIFDQSLNTTDGVRFNSVSLGPEWAGGNIGLSGLVGSRAISVGLVISSAYDNLAGESGNIVLSVPSAENIQGYIELNADVEIDGAGILSNDGENNLQISSGNRVNLQADTAVNITVLESEWQFDNSGVLVFPDGTMQSTAFTGNTVPGSGNTVVFDQDLNTTDSPNFVNLGLAGTADPGYATLSIATDRDFVIGLNDTETGSKVFEFGRDGRLVVPGTMHVDGNIYGGTGNRLWLGGSVEEGTPQISLPNNADGATQPITINNGQGGGVQITTGAGNWTFGEDGSITFPDNTTQSTAADLTDYLKADANGDVQITGTMTADAFESTQTGTPVIYSATEVVIQSNRLRVNQAPLNHGNLTTTQRDQLVAINGDMIYNTTINKFQGYANNVWVDLH